MLKQCNKMPSDIDIMKGADDKIIGKNQSDVVYVVNRKVTLLQDQVKQQLSAIRVNRWEIDNLNTALGEKNKKVTSLQKQIEQIYQDFEENNTRLEKRLQVLDSNIGDNHQFIIDEKTNNETELNDVWRRANDRLTKLEGGQRFVF